MTDSLSILKKSIPAANSAILSAVDFYFNKYANNFAINTPKRIAAFYAQAAHETAGFKTLREYASGTAYEGRKDLGNIYAGDGVKFKGRGIFQITGRANYLATSKKIWGDDRLIKNPALLESPENAVLSALHFWNDRNLNSYADRQDFTGLTKRINGGTNGLADRMKYWGALTPLVVANPALFLLGALKKKSNQFVGDLFAAGRDHIRFFFTGK